MKLKYMCFDSREEADNAFFCDAWPGWKKLDLEKDSPEKVFGFLEAMAADASRNAGSEQVCYLVIDSEGESSDNPRDHRGGIDRDHWYFECGFFHISNYYYGKDREDILEEIATIAWKKGGCFFNRLCSKGLIYGCFMANVPGDASDQEAVEAALNAGVRYVCPSFALPYEEPPIRKFRDRSGRLITHAEFWKALSSRDFPASREEHYEKG